MTRMELAAIVSMLSASETQLRQVADRAEKPWLGRERMIMVAADGLEAMAHNLKIAADALLVLVGDDDVGGVT